jgi:hypothetical protein
VGLERGPLCLVSTTEELLERKSSGTILEIRDYGRRGSAALTTLHPSIRKKLPLTSPKNGGRSVGIVRLRTRATEFLLLLLCVVDELRATAVNSVQQSCFLVRSYWVWIQATGMIFKLGFCSLGCRAPTLRREHPYKAISIIPITVAGWSTAWTIFARSHTEIVGSNPTGGMDVCISSVFVLSCV